MPIQGHRIEKKLSIEEVSVLLSNYNKKDVYCTNHTFFRLSEKQRKVFKCQDIIDYLVYKKPIFAAIQYNGNYAIFYKHKNESCIIRIMVDILPTKIDVITFYMINENQIPRL